MHHYKLPLHTHTHVRTPRCAAPRHTCLHASLLGCKTFWCEPTGNKPGVTVNALRSLSHAPMRHPSSHRTLPAAGSNEGPTAAAAGADVPGRGGRMASGDAHV
eukprot:351429-Chlamydomonas_euryale.AAC.2